MEITVLVAIGNMDEREIDSLVESLRGDFGVTHQIEQATVDGHRSHFRSGELRAIDGANIERFVQNWRSHDSHFSESLARFGRTDLRNYSAGRDIPFLIALGTREGGAGVFQTGHRMVVSAGRDTHREGVSGMDYLYRHARYFRQAAMPISAVSQEELRDGRHDRTPARIEQGALLFAHMIKAASDERAFENAVRTIAGEMHVEASPETLLGNLGRNGRRAWIALFFAGVGYGRRSIRRLFEESRGQHRSPDLNGILTSRALASDMHVVIARATALRARIIELNDRAS